MILESPSKIWFKVYFVLSKYSFPRFLLVFICMKHLFLFLHFQSMYEKSLMRSLLWRHTHESCFFLIHSATLSFGWSIQICQQLGEVSTALPLWMHPSHLSSDARQGRAWFYWNGRPPGNTWCYRLERAEPREHSGAVAWRQEPTGIMI